MDVRIETNFQGALRSFTNARAIFTTTTLHEVAAVIVAAEKAAREGRFVIGFLSYEAAPAFEPHLRVRPGARLPLAWFASFDETTIPAEGNDATEPLEWSLDIDRQSFRTHVERIRAEIAAGRTYQTNFTTRLRGCAPADAYALYQALSRAQGDGYHAFIETNEFTIACASPELFFEIDDRVIRTKPMKGTRPRGRFESEDARLARELAASEKDRAENLMIVDLLRNDVGRIARTGTVVVPALFDVERYRTVHQMTSTVTATLRDDVTLLDVFAALFPCGSVTGAPRISTMQLIAELEDAPRGIYCGALGMIEPGSNRAVFNVPIRTVCIDHGSATAVYGSGAGITYESNADDEYDEVIAKAAILTESWPDFDLLETMRAQNRTILRVDRHIARLLESARYFGWSIDEAAVRAMLATLSLEKAPCRIRLLAHPQRSLRVEVHALDAAPDLPVCALARAPVLSSNRFLFHKTTHRRAYEEHVLADCWDVLLWNERGEITEFTRGNVVVEIDGELLTPARECGLLAGVLRAELLDEGVIRESLIGKSDLARVTRTWFINSLRGWILTSPVPARTAHLSAQP